MINVIVYSPNYFLSFGLITLCKEVSNYEDINFIYCHSYLSALRNAKNATFIFYDESEGADQAKRKIFLIKRINPNINIFSLATGMEYNLNKEARRYIDREHNFKYSTIQQMVKVIHNIKYTKPAKNYNIDYSDRTEMYRSILPSLTEREHLILNLILKGKCNSRIATLLEIAPKTTSCHRRSLFRKMNVRTVVQLFEHMH